MDVSCPHYHRHIPFPCFGEKEADGGGEIGSVNTARDGIGEKGGGHAALVFLTGGVNIQKDDPIGGREGIGKITKEGGRTAIRMRLKEAKQTRAPFSRHTPKGGKRGAYLARMMGVIRIYRNPSVHALFFESQGRSAKL